MNYLLFLSFLSYFLILIWALNREFNKYGPFNLLLFFCIFNFIYNVSIPLEMFLSNDYNLREFNFSPRGVLIVLIMSSLSIIGFVIGISSFSNTQKFIGKHKVDNQFLRQAIPISLKTLMFIIVLVLIFVYRSQLLQSLSYEGNIEASASFPIYKFLLESFTAYYCITCIYLSFKKPVSNLFFLLSIFPFFLISFLTNDKNPLLFALIYFVFNFRFTLSKRNYFLFFLSITILIPVFNLFFSLLRSDNSILLMGDILRGNFFKVTDARGPMISLIVNINKQDDVRFGMTYINSIFQWIPRTFWENRPIDLSQQFAMDNIPEWSPGLGYGYSLLSEAYLNFKIFGGFIQYYIIGLFFGIAYRICFTFFLIKNSIYILSVFICWAFYNVLLMNRTSFILPTTLVRFLLPLLLFSILLDFFKKKQIKL